MVIDKLRTKTSRTSNFGMHFTETGQKPRWGIFDEAMELTSVDFSPHKTTTWKCTDQHGTTGLAHSTPDQGSHQLLAPTTTLPQGKHSTAVCPTTTSPQGKHSTAVRPHNYITTRQAAYNCNCCSLNKKYLSYKVKMILNMASSAQADDRTNCYS